MKRKPDQSLRGVRRSIDYYLRRYLISDAAAGALRGLKDLLAETEHAIEDISTPNVWDDEEFAQLRSDFGLLRKMVARGDKAITKAIIDRDKEPGT